MRLFLAIVAILLAAGATVPVSAADRAPPPVPARSGVQSPLGTIGGVARPGDPNYQPAASVRPDRTFAPNRVGGVARPGDLGVGAPAAPGRAPAAGAAGGRTSPMLAPQDAGPTTRGRATGSGINDPFGGAGNGSGGPGPAQTPR